MHARVFLVLAGAVLCACEPLLGPGDLDESMGDSHQSLNSIDAEINVTISGTYCGVEPQLCVGRDDQCFSLYGCMVGQMPACLPAVERTCRVGLDLGGLDHPFVSQPDDWDDLYLKSNVIATSNVHVGRLKVTFDYGSSGGSINSHHTFVDETFASPIVLAPGGTKHLHTWVDGVRESTVAGLAGADFEDLPWMVRVATHDIGQAGIVKYKPWNDDSQNGCDEFYNFHAAQFSNNIGHATDDNSASFFRHYTTDNGHNALALDQWIAADRAYKLVFDQDAAGDRTNIDGVYACADDDCNTVDRTRSYTPKAGDFFLKLYPGNFHVMMVLGPLIDTSGATVSFTIPILEKSTIVKASLLTMRDSALNARVDPADPTSAFRDTFYFGEAGDDVGALVGVLPAMLE